MMPIRWREDLTPVDGSDGESFVVGFPPELHEEFKKYVPKEILEPTSFRFYCQFFEEPNNLPQDDEKKKLLFEKEIFDGISKSRKAKGLDYIYSYSRVFMVK